MEGNDLVQSIRLIERLKNGLLQWAAHLFQALYNGPERMILDALSNLVLYCYLLSNRVGISFSRLDQGIQEKVKACLQEEEQQKHGLPAEDLINFLRYWENFRD